MPVLAPGVSFVVAETSRGTLTPLEVFAFILALSTYFLTLGAHAHAFVVFMRRLYTEMPRYYFCSTVVLLYVFLWSTVTRINQVSRSEDCIEERLPGNAESFTPFEYYPLCVGLRRVYTC